jgi:hypothetical protein
MGSFDHVVGLIENHHNVVKDAKSGDDIHVFAFTGAPTFGGPRSHWDFDITFSVGPATFEVSVTENKEP